MDYKDIIRDCARRKILDLAKSFLDIVDELKKEEAATVTKFLAVADENGFGKEAKNFAAFLFVLDDSKKEIVRKRILDKTNELIRELEQ